MFGPAVSARSPGISEGVTIFRGAEQCLECIMRGSFILKRLTPKDSADRPSASQAGGTGLACVLAISGCASHTGYLADCRALVSIDCTVESVPC
jgi:hypothetical protein